MANCRKCGSNRFQKVNQDVWIDENTYRIGVFVECSECHEVVGIVNLKSGKKSVKKNTSTNTGGAIAKGVKLASTPSTKKLATKPINPPPSTAIQKPIPKTVPIAKTNAAIAANMVTAKLNLEFTKIRAPIDGRIGRELITEGNLVSGGGADATLLTFIVSVDPIYVYVDVDERSALKYRRLAIHDGNRVRPVPVQLAVADETDFPHLGHIDYISPKADITTGTLSLRGVLANADGLLSPGFFARLRVRGSAPYSALLIPDRAIATDQAQRFVWVVNQDQKVEYRKVILGTHVGQLRVITEGLKVDEWVVIEGIQKLMPGLQVNAERISLVEPKGEK